jgi:hypothetical protein
LEEGKARPERPPPEKERARDLAEVVLPLQRSAGNRAVGALLASQATIARQPAPPKEKDAGGAEQEKSRDIRVTITDVGEFEALSLTFESGGNEKTPEEARPKEVSVTKKADALSAKLNKLAAEGRKLKIEIKMGSMTIRIPDAFISSYNIGGGDTESIQFSGTIEFELPKKGSDEGEQPTPPPGHYPG